MQMNKYLLSTIKKQQGAATLLTAVMILIAITLVTFLSGKTVLMETKMTANVRRSAEAMANAQAAMDFALVYFDGLGFPVAGFDHDDDGIKDDIDLVLDANLVGDGRHDIRDSFPVLSDGTFAISFKINDGSCTTALSNKSALVITVGESDDGLARRTLTQCVATRNILKGDGPKQSLISGSTVNLTGSADIINRYSDLNIWSASTTSIDGSSSMATYIRPPDLAVTDLTTAELLDHTTAPSILNVQEASNKTEGIGSDIYSGDDRLTQSASDFIDLFFAENGEGLADIADSNDQKFTSDIGDTDINNKTDVIFVDGNANLTANGTTVGSIGSPALLLIDGNLTLGGGTYTGLIYVTGTITITGNPNVVGTIISKGAVSGAGALTLVYAENLIGNSKNPLIGATGVISGSWKDW